MPRFVFTLESVLRHRTFAEQERLRDLAVAQSEMTRLQAALKALNDSIQASAQEMKANHLTGTLDVNYLAAHRRYTVATQRQGLLLAQEMARQQRKVDEAQRLLTEAAKERKVIEKLKERQHERWRQDVARKELAETDEAGAQWGYRQLQEAARDAEGEAPNLAGEAATSLAASRCWDPGGGPGPRNREATSDTPRRNEGHGSARERAS